MLESNLRDKFQGCLLGALIGDALGNQFEFQHISLESLKKHMNNAEQSLGKYEYTDDTQMTQELANALLEKGEIDFPHLARRFTERFYKDGRYAGYGQHVINVFEKLRDAEYADCLQPAREQFRGSGSYGNGAAMRVAPVPLFAYPDLKKTAELADQSSLLTHTNELGRHGAIFQAVGIRACLLQNGSITDANEFVAKLEEDLQAVEICGEYKEALNEIKKLLSQDKVVDTQVELRLGNGVEALKSVPTALFAFLLALKPIEGFETKNGFRRTVEYAISLGGDTDTIGSMAGALAGAYYGKSAINPNIITSCPDHELAISQADALYERTI